MLLRAFKMEVGKDYKVISFQGEPERIAALVNGDIQAALISVPHAPRALGAGMKILLRTGDYIQRAGGTMWTMKAYRRRASRHGRRNSSAPSRGASCTTATTRRARWRP